MSTTTPLSVMIEWHGATALLVDLVSDVMGQPLLARAVDGSTIYVAKLLDTECVLIVDHGLEDDSGIEFSRYSHQLQLIPLDSGRFLSSYGPLHQSLGTFLAQRISTALRAPTELVANLQRSLGRFEAGKLV